jgi:hypothetical protein
VRPIENQPRPAEMARTRLCCVAKKFSSSPAAGVAAHCRSEAESTVAAVDVVVSPKRAIVHCPAQAQMAAQGSGADFQSLLRLPAARGGKLLQARSGRRVLLAVMARRR